MLPQINLIAVIAATVFSMALGMLWYGPLFGKAWMKTMNLDKKKTASMKTATQKAYAYSTLASLITAFVLAVVVKYFGVTTITTGAITGLLVWVGFVATTTINGVLFENKPAKAYMIYNTYQLVWFAISGAMLAVWM